MSSDEDDGLVRFGTPLDPIEEDEVPAKRITLADQIAVDSNGKRRFHGAFTGGFAAGYWNTVGSKEGWQPSEFKSSRHEKASQRVQQPSDFMDDEDVGEFGIAPQRIQTTEDYGPAESQAKSKRKLGPSKGPIPGVPVLELVLESFRDKAAVRLLKRMDEKYAKYYLNKMKQKREAAEKRAECEANKETEQEEENGSNAEKDDVVMTEEPTEDGGNDDDDDEPRKVYQCDMGPIARLPPLNVDSDSDDSDVDEADLVFDEDEFDAMFRNMKIDRFGLSYVGLEKGNFFSIVGAEAPVRQNTTLSSFTMLDKNNKSVTIRGQAFGVGAFEEDDDDIYGRDDMTRYDFHSGKQMDKSKARQDSNRAPRNYIDGFEKTVASTGQKQAKPVFRVNVPATFEPRNWIKRKSRFGPETVASTSKPPTKTIVGRHDMTPAQRGDMLNNRKTKLPINSEPDVVWVAPIEPDQRHLEKIKPVEHPMKPKAFVIPDHIPNIFDRFTAPSTTTNDKPEPIEKKEPPPVPEVPKEVKPVVRTRFAWEPVQLLCYKMNMETAVGSKPKKPNTFSLFECINLGPIAKRKNEMEFQKSTHNDDTEESEHEKIRERAKEASTPKALPVTPIPQFVKPSPSPIWQPIQTIHNVDLNDIPLPSKPFVRTITPRTELEKKIIDAKDEHPSKKIDLFKAIFASDSESDNEEDNAEDALAESKKELMASLGKPTTSVPTPSFRAQIPDNPFAPKSAKELNILRNTSPPRGIFRSLIDTNELLAKARAADAQRREDLAKQADENSVEDDAYGPSLPPPLQSQSDKNMVQQRPATSTSGRPGNHIESDIHFDDEWVERSRDRRSRDGRSREGRSRDRSERSSSKKSKKEKKDKKEKKGKKEKKEKKDKREKHKSKKSKKDKHEKRGR